MNAINVILHYCSVCFWSDHVSNFLSVRLPDKMMRTNRQLERIQFSTTGCTIQKINVIILISIIIYCLNFWLDAIWSAKWWNGSTKIQSLWIWNQTRGNPSFIYRSTHYFYIKESNKSDHTKHSPPKSFFNFNGGNYRKSFYDNFFPFPAFVLPDIHITSQNETISVFPNDIKYWCYSLHNKFL